MVAPVVSGLILAASIPTLLIDEDTGKSQGGRTQNSGLEQQIANWVSTGNSAWRIDVMSQRRVEKSIPDCWASTGP